MRILISLITVCMLIFTVGCQTNSVGNIASPVSPPNQGDVTQMPTSIPRPSYTGLQALIEKAKSDLAQRLAVSAN